MAAIPECFCKGVDECNWVVKITGQMYQEGAPETVVSFTNAFDAKNLPQPLAQILFQAAVAGVNENGVKAYAEWLEEVCAPGTGALIQKVAKDVGILKD